MLSLLVAVWIAGDLRAQVAPPPYQFAAPPSVAVIPGTYVYVVPNTDILFYEGYWYRLYTGNWYWAPSYEGPWAYLPPPNVPPALLEVPSDYSYVPPGYPVIPYMEFHANWGTWERERHWDRKSEWREGWHRESTAPHGRPDGRPEGRYERPQRSPEERHGMVREGNEGSERRGDGAEHRGAQEHESHEGRRG